MKEYGTNLLHPTSFQTAENPINTGMKAIVITDNNMGAGHFGNNEVIQDLLVPQIVGDIFAQNNYNKPDDRLLVLGTYEKLLDLLTDWINGDDVVLSHSVCH